MIALPEVTVNSDALRFGSIGPARFDHRQELLEGWRAGNVQPFKDNHLAGNDIDPVMTHAIDREVSRCGVARRRRIGDKNGFISLTFKAQHRLYHADMGFGAANDDRRSAESIDVLHKCRLSTPVEMLLRKDFIGQEAITKVRYGPTNAARAMLRCPDGDIQRPGGGQEHLASIDAEFGIGNRRHQL